jgi:hypothetical protein
MDFSSRRGEAQKLLKDANKLANPSFLGMKMKGDWGSATPLYERAAILFRVRDSTHLHRDNDNPVRSLILQLKV